MANMLETPAQFQAQAKRDLRDLGPMLMQDIAMIVGGNDNHTLDQTRRLFEQFMDKAAQARGGCSERCRHGITTTDCPVHQDELGRLTTQANDRAMGRA